MIKYISLSSEIARKLNFQKLLMKIMDFKLCHCCHKNPDLLRTRQNPSNEPITRPIDFLQFLLTRICVYIYFVVLSLHVSTVYLLFYFPTIFEI